MVKQCALCGLEKDDLTREHVPPKSVFPSPRPENTITVPSCHDCNSSFKLDDEYFRLLIAAGASPESGRHFQLWEEKAVGSTLARSPALKTNLREEFLKIKEFHQQSPLQTFDGTALSDDLVESVQPFDADRINRVLVKTIRGLHFHHEGSPLPASLRFVVSNEPLSEQELRDTIVNRTGLVGGTDAEFVYRYEPLADGTVRWRLLFYVVHQFTVDVSKAEGEAEVIELKHLTR